MKINTIDLTRVRNEAHYQFLSNLKVLLETHPAVADIVSPLMPEFDALFGIERKLVDAETGSLYTEEIANADRRRDRAVVGFHTIIRGMLRHSDPEKVKAAKLLEALIKSSRNEIEKKSYSEESIAIAVLVERLQEEYAAAVATLELSDWVTEMGAAQDEFYTLFSRRASEKTARPAERLADIRKRIDGVYRDIARRIMAYTVLNGAEECAEFIKELNYQITYFKTHDHHHAKKNIGEADILSIPPQVYAGVPVVVLPEVFYEKKRLVFTVDYELSYRNNDRTGMATVFVHGKGAYKGKTLMTFTIAEKQE